LSVVFLRSPAAQRHRPCDLWTGPDRRAAGRPPADSARAKLFPAT